MYKWWEVAVERVLWLRNLDILVERDRDDNFYCTLTIRSGPNRKQRPMPRFQITEKMTLLRMLTIIYGTDQALEKEIQQ